MSSSSSYSTKEESVASVTSWRNRGLWARNDIEQRPQFLFDKTKRKILLLFFHSATLATSGDKRDGHGWMEEPRRVVFSQRTCTVRQRSPEGLRGLKTQKTKLKRTPPGLLLKGRAPACSFSFSFFFLKLSHLLRERKKKRKKREKSKREREKGKRIEDIEVTGTQHHGRAFP